MTNIINNKAKTLRCSKCGHDDVTPYHGQIAFTSAKGWQLYICNSCKGKSRMSPSGLVNCI